MTTITTNAPTTTSALEGEHIKGFVSSYAKCWEHFEAYMQNPDNTYQGFIDACLKEAQKQGIELPLPAAGTFKNKTTKLVKASLIPVRKIPPVSDNPEAVRQRKHRASVTAAQSVPMSQTANPTPANSNDQQQVRLLQSPDDSCSVVEPEIVTDLQMGGPEVDIRSFTPVLEQLLFGIEAARRNSANTAEEWGSLSAMLQTLYHHAQCESKQRRLRRDRETAE